MLFEDSSTPLFQAIGIPFPHSSKVPVSEQVPWLVSPRADFWLACGGAPVGLLAVILLIFLHGDRELDALDFVLSELHLGATYDAVIRRRLWRHRQVDVMVIPLVILALTYVFSLSGQTILLTSIAMYAAVWHRGRQSFGVARFYQRGVGGPVSRAHDVLFRGAIYLPMFAAALAYGHLSPASYEEKPYLALNVGAEMTSLVGIAAALWVIAYLVWTLRESAGRQPTFAAGVENDRVHLGERYVVLAHALAFGSAYILGASNASFLLVLAVHHEVQYLYFTYAMARRTEGFQSAKTVSSDVALSRATADRSLTMEPGFRHAVRHAATFLRWPVIGFVGAVVGGWLQLAWLAPLGIGGLFCHYWLDGRIWTRRSTSGTRGEVMEAGST
jgi:hypothetical protein